MGLTPLARAYRAFFNKISRHVTCEDAEQWAARLERTGFKVEKYWHYFSPSALAALESKAIEPWTVLPCNGYLTLADIKFHCWLKGGHGGLNVTGAIAAISMDMGLHWQMSKSFAILGRALGGHRADSGRRAPGRRNAGARGRRASRGGRPPDSRAAAPDAARHTALQPGDGAGALGVGGERRAGRSPGSRNAA